MFSRPFSNYLIFPGVFAFLIPTLLGFFDPWSWGGLKIGLMVLGIGLVIFSFYIRDFYVSGKNADTVSWHPPELLRKKGLYRYIRNPLYLGIILNIAGITIISGSLLSILYLLLMTGVFHFRVVVLEEPHLKRKYKEEWLKYRQEVPRWIPRIKPKIEQHLPTRKS